MSTTIEALIAQHVPERAKARALINALAEVIGAAQSHLEDWQTGLADGTYEGTHAFCAKLEKALALVES